MLRSIKRTLTLYKIFFIQQCKKLMEYKLDFMTGAISFLIGQVLNIAFIQIIFSQIPSLQGWSQNKILFIYAFSLIPKGLDHLLADNLWCIAWFIVKNGDFDKYLTRPINPLVHVMMERIQFDALGELILGIVMLVLIPDVGITWSFEKILFMIIMIPFATMIYTSIKIFGASIALKTKKSGTLLQIMYMTNDFAKYPVTIYNKLIRNLITYFIPFAFTAYYPALYILTGKNPLFNIGGTIIISTLLFCISYSFWKFFLKKYESAGS